MISAAARSAEYSRVRLTAICTIIAAIGATMRRDQHRDEAERVVVVARAAAEEQREIGQHRDRAGNGRRDRHGQRVAVLHVAELVRHHRGDLVAVERAEEPGGRRDRGVLGVSAGGEGVGLRAVDDVDLRHRQAGLAAQAPARARRYSGARPRVDLAGAVHPQHHLVRVPVGEEVHAGGEDQREHHAAGAADQVADAHEDRRQRGEEHGGAHEVHRLSPFGRGMRPSR